MNNLSLHTNASDLQHDAVTVQKLIRVDDNQTCNPSAPKAHQLFEGSGMKLNFTNVQFSRRETMFLEDDHADCFYEITSGMVCLFMSMPDGRRQIVRFASKGDIVGLTLLDRYEMSAETITRATAMRINPNGLREKLATSPQLATNLLAFANTELADAYQHVMMIGRKSATERVAAFLWLMAEKCELHGREVGHIPLAMSRSDIADFLGLTTETVSRAITHLRKENLITCAGAGRVLLKNAESLRDLALGEAA